MKKKRYFPFSYCMTEGKIEIVPAEAELVQKIFRLYLEGNSLQQLARMAELSGIRFSENAASWNKNMIARMLDDSRYWSEGQFPAIISLETAESAAAMRAAKSTEKTPLHFICRKTICGKCGSALIQGRAKAPDMVWICKGCGQQIGPIHRMLLKQTIEKQFLELYSSPELAVPVQTAAQPLSLKAARMEGEIRQLLNQRQVDAERVLQLIKACAAEKYQGCSIGRFDYRTANLLQLLKSRQPIETFDVQLFGQVVKKVILAETGTVQFLLYNQKIL